MTPLTRAAIEKELLSRAKQRMQIVNMDAATQNGTNADLNGPIRKAVHQLNFPTNDPQQVTDADVAAIVGWQVEKLYDLATLQLLENILVAAAYFDNQVGVDQQKLNQLIEQTEKAIEIYRDKVAKPYGLNMPGTAVAPLTTGKYVPNDPLGFPRGATPYPLWPYPQ